MKKEQVESSSLKSSDLTKNLQLNHQHNDSEDHISIPNNFDYGYREEDVNSMPSSLSNHNIKKRSTFYTKYRVYIQYVKL